MIKLARSVLNEACQEIVRKGRPLEAALCTHYFINPCPELVLAELQRYQNTDGGFGNGLEPDFQLADSSPIATSIAFQILTRFDEYPGAAAMIVNGIKYFESSFIASRNGWLAVPSAVNDYPHTPWWHFNAEKGMTIIDEHWGNPSAEIAGYLYKYSKHVISLDVDEVLSTAICHLESKAKFEDFHEVFSYIRLHNLLPHTHAIHLRDRITVAVHELLSTSPEEWESDYQPKPMDFVGDSEYEIGISSALIETNILYAIEKLTKHKLIQPTWSTESYTGELACCWNQWLGILTLQTLRFLDTHKRIDR